MATIHIDRRWILVPVLVISILVTLTYWFGIPHYEVSCSGPDCDAVKTVAEAASTATSAAQWSLAVHLLLTGTVVALLWPRKPST